MVVDESAVLRRIQQDEGDTRSEQPPSGLDANRYQTPNHFSGAINTNLRRPQFEQR